MTGVKKPASLRAVRGPGASKAVIPQRESAAAMAAVCLVAMGASAALGQTATGSGNSGAAQSPAQSGAGQLPPLTVQAPAKKAAPKAANRPITKRAPSSASAATAAPATALVGVAAPSIVVAPGGNPYADPAAPYKVDRSANTKLTEPILDTPRTVTTVSKEVLQDKGATSVRELARTTPGVTLGTGEGGNPFGDRLYIRGFDARNDAYINGIRDSGVPIRETFTTEQVEILKGPSATIGGRGTSGGAINLITKQAQEKNFTHGTATLGTDNTVRGTLDHNMAVLNNFAVRGNLMWQNADVAGRDEVFDNRMGGSIAVMWKPVENVKINTDYYHLKLDQLPDWGVPWDTVGRAPFTESGVSRRNYYGYPARDFQKGQQDVFTNSVEWKLSDFATVTNRSRYGVTETDYIAGTPGNVTRTAANPLDWTVASQPKSRWQENEVLANQTDLTLKFSTMGVKHTMVAGVEVNREKITRDGYTGLTSEAFGAGGGAGGNGSLVLNLFNPNTGSLGFNGAPRLSGNLTEVLVDSSAFYVLDTIKLSEQWIVTGGLRLDNYGLHYDALNATTGVHTLLSRNDHLLNYNVGLTWKPLPIGSVYAAYGTSSNPVGQELDGNGDSYGGIAAGNQLLDPEKNTSIELGTKWELFNRHVLVTAALFQTEKANAREAAGQLVFSTGKYRLQGYELGIGGKIGALSIYGGYVGMESEILESRTPSEIGKRFANIAHDSFNLLAKYELTNWLTVGGQATYRGQIFGGTLGRNDNTIPDYWRFDALADFKLNDTFTLSLQGLNLTDQVYYDALYRSGAPYVYIASGRAGYATLKIKY